MKNQIKFLMLFLLIPFLTNGCYTILWTPEDNFPDESNYGYYDSYYFNDYNYYYDYPWWLSITPPVKSNDDKVYERDNSTTTLRNNGNGRNTDSGREILNTPLPTRNYNPPTSGSDNSSETSTTTRNESVNSNNNTRQSSGSNSGSVRNNDGNRNNGRGR